MKNSSSRRFFSNANKPADRELSLDMNDVTDAVERAKLRIAHNREQFVHKYGTTSAIKKKFQPYLESTAVLDDPYKVSDKGGAETQRS